MLVKSLQCRFGVEATTITVEVPYGQRNWLSLSWIARQRHKRKVVIVLHAALKNNSYSMPGKKITINMAPADLKEGSSV